MKKLSVQLVIVFLMTFGFLMTLADAAFAGCLYQNVCLQNGAALLNSFTASFPQHSGGFLYQHSPGNVGYPTVTDACVISNFQLTKIDLITGGITSGISQVYRMDTCDVSIVDSGHMPHVLAILATVFLFAYGFRVGGSMSNLKGGFS